MSESYFTNRLDSYIVLDGQPSLADHFEAIYQVARCENVESYSVLSFKELSPKLLERFSAGLTIPVIHTCVTGLLSEPIVDDILTRLVPHDIRYTTAWLMTPYLNPPQDLMDFMNARRIETLNVVSSAQACNGFWGARGLASLIPKLYDSLKLRFLQFRSRPSLPRAAGEEFLLAFSRKEWTFHSKTLMFCGQGVAAVICGSSNFGIYVVLIRFYFIGYRSFSRDVENLASFVTTDPNITNELQKVYFQSMAKL